MRISDWSSDVCSSDLRVVEVRVRPGRPGSFIPGFILPRHRQRAAERLGEPDELFAEHAIDCGRDLGDLEAHITADDVVEADRSAGIGGFDLDRQRARDRLALQRRSEEHTSELQSLMRISYAVYCLITKLQSYQQHNQ